MLVPELDRRVKQQSETVSVSEQIKWGTAEASDRRQARHPFRRRRTRYE